MWILSKIGHFLEECYQHLCSSSHSEDSKGGDPPWLDAQLSSGVGVVGEASKPKESNSHAFNRPFLQRALVPFTTEWY